MIQKERKKKKKMFANSYHVALLCWSVLWDVFELWTTLWVWNMGAQNGQWK